jgi:hypothetical protein
MSGTEGTGQQVYALLISPLIDNKHADVTLFAKTGFEAFA